MARKFHHKNGATTYRENDDSVNYMYKWRSRSALIGEAAAIF
jgi:hypothetical protein